MKPIKNYETLYSVNIDGKIFSLKHNREIKPSKLKSGYSVVNLNNGVKIKTFYHHRLVAETLIENPNNLPFINHKDKNRSNNSPENLEWVTSQRNNEYSLSKEYTLKSPSGELIQIFNMAKFCRENDLDDGAMNRVIKGYRPHHKGWTIQESFSDNS